MQKYAWIFTFLSTELHKYPFYITNKPWPWPLGLNGEVIHPITHATALHVASSKGYLKVMKLVWVSFIFTFTSFQYSFQGFNKYLFNLFNLFNLSNYVFLFLCPLHNFTLFLHHFRTLFILGVDINAQDCDGWTALHAAAHWSEKEACQLLVINGSYFFFTTLILT